MKKTLTAAIILLLAATHTSSAAPDSKKFQPQVQQNGRYQIISVEYNSLNLNGDNTKKGVLKIDTLTGETWVLSEAVFKTPEGHMINDRGWEKLERYIETKDNILIKQR